MNIKLDIRETIKGVADGGTRQIPLSRDVNVSSFRTVASKLNALKGYKKYVINVNSVLGIMTIINHDQA